MRYTLGVDNEGVVRHVGRLLDGLHGSVPFELVKDGDLLVLIDRMLHLRGHDTVQITKVKGHADQRLVLDGQVREVDRLGNNAADEAADFGRRRVSGSVIDARRNLSGVCGRWYLVILDLHRFFIAISRAVVNHETKTTTHSSSSWSWWSCWSGEVIKFSPRNRIQQRLVESNTLTFSSSVSWRSSRLSPWTGFNSFILSLTWCCG